MKYLRRMMSFLAVRLIVFTVCASVVVCAFYMAFEIGNAYVLISEGMEKRVSVALTRENATRPERLFHHRLFGGRPRAQRGVLRGFAVSGVHDHVV